jgi:flavin-dependent dehydrogenase
MQHHLHHHPRFDAVIVGGRVAGAATAMLLARAGRRVAVVERAPATADALSTHILFPAGNLQLQRWALLDDVVASGTAPTTQLVATVDGMSLPLPFPDPATGLRALHHPRRTVLDPLILAAAVEAGVEVFDGVAVDDVLWEDDRVVGVTGRRRDGSPMALRARILVGADGMRSRVARSVDAPTYDEVGVVNATHYAYWSGLDDRGLEVWSSTAGLMAGVVPTNGGSCVFVNCRPDHLSAFRPDPAVGFHRLLVQVAPDLSERLRDAEQTSPIRGTPGIPSFKRRPWGPGWVLVGDAGCTKDPVSAHGISDAMVSAELAARAIDSVLAGAPERPTMAAFHEHRDAFVSDIYDIAREWASYAWTAEDVLDIQARYGVALVAAARTVRAFPCWAGMPALPPVRRSA